MIRTVLFCLLCLAAGDDALAGEKRVPATTFAQLPVFKSMSLSPDGKKIVALRAFEETYHAILIDFEAKSSKILVASDPEQFLFDSCRFANNERVVCTYFMYVTMIAGDTGLARRRYRDGRTTFTRMVAINTDRTDMIELVKPARATNSRERVQWNAPNQSDVINWLPDDENHVLIQLAREDRVFPTVYRLNIYNNDMKRVKRYRNRISNWFANDAGDILLAAGRGQDLKPVAASLLDGWEWLDLSRSGGIEPPTVQGFAGDGESMWVIGNAGEDTRGVYQVSLKTGAIMRELYRHPEYDVDRLVLNPATGEPLYAEFVTDVPVRHWFDEVLGKTFEEVRATLPGSPDYVMLHDMDRSLNRVILYTEGNGTIPSWHLFDREAKSLTLISTNYDDFGEPVKFRSVTYKARDKLDIPAYLALPGASDEGPWPTIILPHGGPYSRDTSRFDYMVQMMVNRGYAVLKPNFRGSTGFGDEFTAAGFGQWGLAMQDDLIDGLNWMIESGYTDPKRVCIVGLSYGGYAALVAAYKTPDRFRCAVSFGGISDLDELAQRAFNFRLGRLSVARLPGGDLREQNSPIKNVDKIGIPLLLVHGDVDRNVMIEQSTSFVEALEQAEKDYIYIEQPNGDHYLSLQSHRNQFMEALDQFLAAHLKP